MSLRTKQALILFLATVLPFAIGGAAMDLVVAPAYRRVVMGAASEVVRHLADHAAWSLERGVGSLQRVAASDRLRALARRPRRTLEEARRLDRQWKALPTDSKPIRALLENPAAWELWHWQQTDLAVREVLATDARGCLVAATRKSSDFYQADERWWQESFAEGKGRVYVSDLLFDESARAWGLEIAVPIYKADTPPSRAIGVLKVVLDAARAFQDIRKAGDSGGEVALVDREGRIVAARGRLTAVAQPIAASELALLRQDPSGSRVAREEESRALLAWMRVPLREELPGGSAYAPDLYVLSRRDAAEAFGPLRTVQAWMLAIGLVTIVIAGALGYWLTDLLVVRQIRKLAAGMRHLARGDFHRAASVAHELTHGDEEARDEEARDEEVKR